MSRLCSCSTARRGASGTPGVGSSSHPCFEVPPFDLDAPSLQRSRPLPSHVCVLCLIKAVRTGESLQLQELCWPRVMQGARNVATLIQWVTLIVSCKGFRMLVMIVTRCNALL